MRYNLKTIAVAAVLTGATSLGAAASPVPASKPLAAGATSRLTETISFRRAHWPGDSPCRKGGRFYTYGGGWGCDYYLYGLWPARPPRRW
jgi:Spy/CpxP family protein refolding chaperone